MDEVKCHDFILGPVDTDSISFCRKDQTPFSEEEQEQLLQEINALLPKLIRYEHDGAFKKIIVCRAKNYITATYDGKVKIKGSALKATGKPEAMKEMIKKVIDSLLNNRDDFINIYNEYVKEAANIKDMKRWASRKTISSKTLNSERANETRIKDAIEDSEYVEGDRCYMFNKSKTELALVENFDGQYDVDKTLESCYNTIYVFENILDCELMFSNYRLKKNKAKLQELLNNVSM